MKEAEDQYGNGRHKQHCKHYKPDICRTLQSTVADYTFFSNSHGAVSRIDHMLAMEQVSIH